MPTASPSISPRTGVVLLRVMKPVRVVMAAAPMPTPRNAVSSGSPAAASEPNIASRTIAATTTPSSSPIPPVAPFTLAAVPDSSTCSPVWVLATASSFC